SKELSIKSSEVKNILSEKIYTVSSSEGGIEKIYQGISLYFVFTLNDGINNINIEIGEKR
ncbi:MAG: DUF1926 domain-containing protein, partial [Caldisericia bacterium]|nr:DUF1926 domain-containing protein [Caldisericia bacterium]